MTLLSPPTCSPNGQVLEGQPPLKAPGSSRPTAQAIALGLRAAEGKYSRPIHRFPAAQVVMRSAGSEQGRKEQAGQGRGWVVAGSPGALF